MHMHMQMHKSMWYTTYMCHALSRELAMHLPYTCHAPDTRPPPHPSLTQVLPGTPAAASGKFQLGDILRSIDGHSIDGIQAADVLTRSAVHTLEVCTSTKPNPNPSPTLDPSPSPGRNPMQPYATLTLTLSLSLTLALAPLRLTLTLTPPLVLALALAGTLQQP